MNTEFIDTGEDKNNKNNFSIGHRNSASALPILP